MSDQPGACDGKLSRRIDALLKRGDVSEFRKCLKSNEDLLAHSLRLAPNRRHVVHGFQFEDCCFDFAVLTADSGSWYLALIKLGPINKPPILSSGERSPYLLDLEKDCRLLWDRVHQKPFELKESLATIASKANLHARNFLLGAKNDDGSPCSAADELRDLQCSLWVTCHIVMGRSSAFSRPQQEHYVKCHKQGGQPSCGVVHVSGELATYDRILREAAYYDELVQRERSEREKLSLAELCGDCLDYKPEKFEHGFIRGTASQIGTYLSPKDVARPDRRFKRYLVRERIYAKKVDSQLYDVWFSDQSEYAQANSRWIEDPNSYLQKHQ